MKSNNKKILDACCGGRMAWFDKNHPQTLFADFRRAGKGHVSLRPNHSVEPDELIDFRNMPHADGSFKLVLFDPPHILKRNGAQGIMEKKYGYLDRENWREHLQQGFNECWRVLSPDGVLIFKWSEAEVPLSDVLECFSKRPLFGHRTTKGGTHWLCFMKCGESNE